MLNNIFNKLFGPRVVVVRGKNNNGPGTFKRARSREFWNSSRQGTYVRPDDHPKSVRRNYLASILK